MNSRDAIQRELKDLRSSLPVAGNKQPVFTVPEGYFENFAASVLAKVNHQPAMNATEELQTLSPLLAAIPKQTPFAVPENYFAHLATGLPALTNEEGALPDFLKTHTKQMPYAVPSGYFDGLAAQVAAKVPRQRAKVVSLPVRFARYAAAAVVAGLITVGGILYLKKSNSGAIDPATQPGAWVAQQLKNVPNSDLEAFLKTTDTGFNSTEVARSGTDVRRMLTDVSTTELDAFLRELPADADFSRTN